MNWPDEKVVVRLGAQLATKIRKAFKSAIDGDAIARAWAETHPAGGSVSPQMARDWTLVHAVTNSTPMQHALSRVYADGYTLGERIAKARLKGLRKDASVGIVDWSTWQPGLPSAAALVKPSGGLKQLLDSRKITISNDVIRTKLDRIGTALATGLDRGFSANETAKMIDKIINDPSHALTIANTEMNRAMSIATRDRYETAQIEQVEWLVAEGCDDCQENADASPIGIDETFPTGDSEPPAHPNCMCALAPYYDYSQVDNTEQTDITAEDFVSQHEDFASSTIDGELSQISEATNVTIADKDNLLNQMSFQRELGFYDNKSIPANQSNALTAYTGNSYLRIQSVLREGNLAAEATSPEHFMQIKQAANDLQTLIKSAPALEKDLITYRGVIGDIAKDFVNLQPKDIITDKGFSSTSLLREKAEIYASQPAQGASQHGVILEILNPAGTRGINVEAFFEKLTSSNPMFESSAPSTTRTQYEWLLPHDSRFEVLSNDGKTIRVVVK